jgi:glutathione S-transferase
LVTLNILKPSVNNMTVRVFVRAAGLDVTEADAWGHTRSEAFMAKCPAHSTPMIETDDLPNGALWESCAIMQYLCNKHQLEQFYPSDPGRRAMIDSAMFYLTGTLYPLVARATYPVLGFPAYPGEVAASDATAAAKDAARLSAQQALDEPLAAIGSFFIGNQRFIGGASPSIADIRLASTLEFLGAVPYTPPAWVPAYLTAVADALGAAYAEPAADVRGYIKHVTTKQN